MIRISFLFFALLASATGVPDDNMSIPAIIVADNAFGAIAGGDVNKVTGCTHYEHPPCGSDEKAVQVMGVDGVFCSPMCTPDGVCPHDVPKGVIAHPTCALQTPTGEQFCAILCTPSSSSSSSLRGGDCGPMDCVAVPNGGGIGLCVYSLEDKSKTGDDEDVPKVE